VLVLGQVSGIKGQAKRDGSEIVFNNSLNIDAGATKS
jgi:hypothetical protein